jgi:drug/metabolite transporter (DMT)-like permease
MSQKTRTWLFDYSGDLAMFYMTIIAGLNFVVMRDAVSDFSPLAFNAIRMSLGASITIPFLLHRLPRMQFDRRDIRALLIATLLTIPVIQALMVTALSYTTSSNVSLMLATGPAWTVMLTVLNGTVSLRKGLLYGLGIMLAGSALVIASRGSGFAMSTDDLIGCGMMLTGAMLGSWYIVYTKPINDRSKTIDIILIKATLIAAGVSLMAAPELVTMTPGDIPTSLLPNILFGGLIASISGNMTTTFAQRKIGPTRMKVYDNIIPATTAIFGFIFLGEPITALLVFGGGLTLYGVMMVRRNARPTAPATVETAPVIQPHQHKTPVRRAS